MKKQGSDMKRAGLFTMLLHIDSEYGKTHDVTGIKAHIFPGEPSEADTKFNPIQKLLFNDGMRSVWVLVYASRKVNIEFVKHFVRLWRDGEWLRIDLRKTRTNNVAKV